MTPVVLSLLISLASAPVALAKPKLAGAGDVTAYQQACAVNYQALATSRARTGYDKVGRIRRRFAEFTGIGKSDNREFIRRGKLANAGAKTEAGLYLDLENAVLKELNDEVIRDRELVTALTNLHKDVAWSAISGDPVLAAALLDKYSDFKSMRFAFREDSPEVRERSAELLRKINRRYAEYLASLVEGEGWANRMSGLTASARNWYHGGLGASPDQAGLAARYSRDQLGNDGIATLRAYREAAPYLRRAASQVSRFRKWAAKRFAKVEGFLVRTESGKEVLSAEVIEAIKKALPHVGESRAGAVARALRARFGIPIDPMEARMLEGYLEQANRFSPGLLEEERIVIDMNVAARSVISADFKGQNARNLEETMKALAGTEGRSLDERLRAVRAGEEKATRSLQQKKERFQRALDLAFPGRGIEAKFTGDDGVAFLDFGLTDEMRKTFQRAWLGVAGPEDARLAFLPLEKLAGDARSEWIVKAEGLEKKLRRELIEGHIPRSRLNGMQIGIYLDPDRAGEAGVYLAMKAGESPSAPEIQAVEEVAKRLGYRAQVRVPGPK